MTTYTVHLNGRAYLVTRNADGSFSLLPELEQHRGFGTALKPATEPIIVARRPLVGTVAGNVLAHGTGALNIEACRVATGDDLSRPASYPGMMTREYQAGQGKRPDGEPWGAESSPVLGKPSPAGRWPSNFVLSHAGASMLGPDGVVEVDACVDGCVVGCPVADLDAQSGDRPGNSNRVLNSRDGKTDQVYGAYAERSIGGMGRGDSGGASRFFPVFRYQAKAPTRERPKVDGVAHPTVKPLALLSWLVRLVTPPGGTVLDPFAGSGTTGEAALAEGFRAVLVEAEADYLPLIAARLARVDPQEVLDIGA